MASVMHQQSETFYDPQFKSTLFDRSDSGDSSTHSSEEDSQSPPASPDDSVSGCSETDSSGESEPIEDFEYDFDEAGRIADQLVDELCELDTEEEELLQLCVTCLIVVTLNLKTGDSSEIILFTGGAVDSVSNKTVLLKKDRLIVCTRTISIYSKDLRIKIDTNWEENKHKLPDALSHLAFDQSCFNGTSFDIEKAIKPEIVENTVTFTNQNIRVVHRTPATAGAHETPVKKSRIDVDGWCDSEQAADDFWQLDIYVRRGEEKWGTESTMCSRSTSKEVQN